MSSGLGRKGEGSGFFAKFHATDGVDMGGNDVGKGVGELIFYLGTDVLFDKNFAEEITSIDYF